MTAWDTNAAIKVLRSQERSLPVMADEGLEASRHGARVSGWICEVTALNVAAVMTNAAMVYNLKPGERLVVAKVTIGLTTLSDSVKASIGYCTAADGGGDFYPMMRCLRDWRQEIWSGSEGSCSSPSNHCSI